MGTAVTHGYADMLQIGLHYASPNDFELTRSALCAASLLDIRCPDLEKVAKDCLARAEWNGSHVALASAIAGLV